MNRFIYFFLIVLLGFSVNDNEKHSFVLKWTDSSFLSEKREVLYFENCDYLESESQLPYFVESITIDKNRNYHVELGNAIEEEINFKLSEIEIEFLKDDYQIKSAITQSGDINKLHVEVLPFKKVGDKVFKLKKFDLKYIPKEGKLESVTQMNWKSESVLSSGKWIKIETKSKGIYKLPYSTLGDWGFANPQNVNVYGNTGHMLPENTSEIEIDDLDQISIWKGKDNGGNDCIFFYSTGNTKWELNETENKFRHQTNVYSTSNYFFLTEDIGTEKIAGKYEEIIEEPTHSLNSFDEYLLHEKEQANLIKSGKNWFGESFINGTSRNIEMNCANKVDEEPIQIRIKAVGRSGSKTKLKFNINNSFSDELEFSKISITNPSSIYGRDKVLNISHNPTGENLSFDFTYDASTSVDGAWLDYIELNYKKSLSFINSELFFRDFNSVGEGNITDFKIGSANSTLKVFDVTEPSNMMEAITTVDGNTLSFKRPSAQLREYVVFNPTGNIGIPEKTSDLSNQDLHASSNAEMIIISHPDLIEASNELAEFHRTYDEMDILVVTTSEVFNEFSVGMADATGIRNFIKMSREKNPKLKYILLFGDGSYDNRNILGESNKLIPTYQADNSLSPTSSFVTDDYFVLLDEGESVYGGAVDLGIGRIPSSTAYEANIVVNKIKNYYKAASLGNWRNVVSFIGDDQDEGQTVHMENSEILANMVNSINGAFVTNKIYLDAFAEESTTAGERYPDVTNAINERVNEGVLILNYVGHANERFMADEHVLDISHINSWTNKDNLPIFVTATCEFSRFDDDELSAGEHILFNPNGGGIGLFSTTRLVFSGSNHILSKSFYNTVFDKGPDGRNLRLGDIMRITKVGGGNSINKRSFSLLADPAIRLAYPEFNVVTSSLNQSNALGEADTISALNAVTVSGHIEDFQGNKLTNFNGELTPVVYGKAEMLETLGNDGGTPVTFKVQDKIIYKGLASVTNGEFSFTFVIPKDIPYSLGKGKIIYYAENGEKDANGAFENFYIGGSTDNQVIDNIGPNLDLYLDDTNFKSGDATSSSPLMLAYISDENGINTVGSGIGHDITATLDGDYSNSIVLNDYYQADIDNYKSGYVEFPFSGLSEGKHTLRFKVWDVANNSSEVEIEFIVGNNLEITEVSNYPNPATGRTNFTFTHNQPSSIFDALIEIIDRNGRVVDSFIEKIPSSGNKSVPVSWDPNSSGVLVKNGLYFYRITIKSSSGAVASKTGKMIFVQ